MPVDKVSIEKFAQSVKQQYPAYKDINDTLLTQKILEQYPQYKKMVDFSPPQPTPTETAAKQTSDKVNEGLQFNGTFQPDLEGEKKGLYLNDPEYQKQKQDFVSKILTDDKGGLLYPEQDKAGNWFNYYDKKQLKNFDPRQMEGRILQVPHEYLAATGGQQFITPKLDKRTGNVNFPGVETPSAPHMETLPETTVYGGKEHHINEMTFGGATGQMIEESKRQGGQLRNILEKHPSLEQDIDNTLEKYGEPYKQSLKNGSQAMQNILTKTIEDRYGLNEPIPANINLPILNSHLAVMNSFDENRKQFEETQKELQHQADLITDHSKRTGEPINQDEMAALAQKQNNNIQKWNNYTKSVNFSQNYLNQPEIKDFLAKAQRRQEGIKLIDEIRQRAFPHDVAVQEAGDEYSRKALEGNLNLWDYLKTATGRAASGLSNITQTTAPYVPMLLSGGLLRPTQETFNLAEQANKNAQQVIDKYLPQISPETIEQMDKRGIGHLVNDVSAMVGGFAPYIIPGLAEGNLSRAATFATSLAETLPQVKKEAEEQGLTGKAYDTYLTAKPLIDAAFMSLLPNAKFAKGYEEAIGKSIINGELNNPKRMLLDLVGKVIKDPSDVAHIQAMLSGTALGDAAINDITNHLQATEDAKRGIVRQGGLSTDISNVFNPKQTATMALAGKILSAIPTLSKAGEDLRYKDVQKAYDNATTNLVELAATNLEGVTKKLNELSKKNPGDFYVNHIKNTIEEFARAEAGMPEGLVPEQKAALFDIQQKIKNLQSQQGKTFADWKEHIAKNIEELKKQIPDILKDSDKANKYLQSGHNDLVNQIKTETDGKETNNAPKTEGRQEIEKPQGAALEHQISETAPASVQQDANYRTLNYGKHKGTQENEEAKASIKDDIINDRPIGETGERFSEFLKRVIPNFKNLLAKEPHNTALVTHSSVIKALQVWEEMERPDVNESNIKEFAQRYVDLKPEAEGKVHTFKGDNGNDIKVIRHGETEDNKLSEFRDDNTQLTDKGIEQAKRAGQNLLQETGGDVPKIISSDLPRTLHTSDIINQQIKEHALQKRPATEMGAYPGGNESLGRPGESEGMGSSKQGNGPAGESGQPGAAKEESKVEGKETEVDALPFVEEEGDNEFTSTKNAVTKQKVEDAGLEPAMKEAARDFGTVWKQATKNYTKDPAKVEKLINDLSKKPRAVTDLENASILFHQNVKEAALDDANKRLDQARKDNDRQAWNEAYDDRARLLDDLQKIYDVDKKIGRETARGLNARKMMADRRFSLVNMQMEKRAANGGEPLTPEQESKIQQQYEDIKKTKEAYEARIDELQKENARLQAEKQVSSEKKEAERAKKSKEQYSKERKDIVQRMRDDLLKAAKGGEGLTLSVPLAAQLKAIAPHIRDLVKSFIDQGVDKLEDITKGIHDILKPLIPDLEEKHIHDLIAGEYNEPVTKTTEKSKYQQIKEEAGAQKYRITDPKLMKLQADYERAKDAYAQSLKADENKKRTKWQKTQDAFLKYERFAKLSNPITLGKLAMAAITRLATAPLEETVGAGYSAALPGIAKKAPGEAGVNVNALARGYKESFMRGMSDAATLIKGGKTDIEAIYGKKGTPPPEALDFFGQLHSALKAPVKRFAFERSFQKRLANNIKNGVTIDGMTEARIALESYKDAERSIFMQDNPISRGWRNALNAMEKGGDMGKFVSTLGQWLIPFVKVPTNILGETLSHVAGPEIALGKVIATSLGKGLENLTQDEAEMIMRNLKKGTIGHAALLAGYLNPSVFGGYYQKGEKRPEEDAKIGAMKIGEARIPAWMLEAPLFQAMQIGATIRRVKDTMVKGEEKGIGEGLWAAGLGLMSHEPLLDEPSRLTGMLASPTERQYFLGELAKSTLVPAASEYAAKVMDPADKRTVPEKLFDPENKRKPETVKEHIESAIPGLREDAPEKKPTGGHRQRQHR